MLSKGNDAVTMISTCGGIPIGINDGALGLKLLQVKGLLRANI